MPTCVLRYCTNNSSNTAKYKGITFHRFPRPGCKNRGKWIQFVQNNRSEETWLPSKQTYVCSLHFREEDKYTTKSGRLFLKKTAVPCADVSVSATSQSQMKKKIEEMKKQRYNPLKEYANDSTEEESPENSDKAENSDDAESEKSAPATEKVFLKSMSCKEKKPEDQPEFKRARLDTSDGQFDYTEELYEFGKFVAEQLMCLDVKDARVAQTEIREVLSKFNMNKIMRCLAGPNTSNAHPAPDEHFTQILAQVNPVRASITQARSTVNTAEPSGTQSMFSQVDDVRSLETQSKFSRVDTAGSSDTQSKFSRVDTAGSSETQLGSQEITARQLGTHSELGSLPQFAMVNVNPGASTAPIGYVIVSTSTGRGQNLTSQLENIEGKLVVQTSETSLVSTVTQTGSSNMCFSETSVKTEPESESSQSDGNVIVPTADSLGVANTELLVKKEPDSEDET